MHATLGEVMVHMESLITSLEGGNMIMTMVNARFLFGLVGKLVRKLGLLWIWSELVVLGSWWLSSNLGFDNAHWYVSSLYLASFVCMDQFIFPLIYEMNGFVVWGVWNWDSLKHGLDEFQVWVESIIMYVLVSSMYGI